MANNLCDAMKFCRSWAYRLTRNILIYAMRGKGKTAIEKLARIRIVETQPVEKPERKIDRPVGPAASQPASHPIAP